MYIVPINMAEAIFDPMWDPKLSELDQWQITPGPTHGLQVSQGWCYVTFDWAQRPASGPALAMTRELDLDCSGYDRLLVSLMAPEGTIVRFAALTNHGEIDQTYPPAPALKRELALELGADTTVRRLTLEITATRGGVDHGWLNWFGLQSSELMGRYEAQWHRFDAEWAPYLKPESYEPAFEPAYGILASSDEIAALRTEHAAFVAEHGDSPYLQAARAASSVQPEEMIRDFVNFWNDTRYCRERDHENILLPRPGHGSSAAIAGLLKQDKSLLRLAARFAMALGLCGRWDDGMICAFPGSTFEHRCFVQSLCVHEVALILDLAGEMFTDLGRELLLRRIAEEGQGAINWNTWGFEYIFHCNQLAWFTPGRMLGYAVLEQTMPRVKPYTDLAYTDLDESLGYAILPDGGYVEGPSYFQTVGRNGGLSLHYYARLRGMSMRDIIPENMRRTADFAEACLSTDKDADVIPICDGHAEIDEETAAVMGNLLPNSQWARIYHKAIAREGGFPAALFSWQLGRDIPTSDPPLRPFVQLADMGIMSSVRALAGENVKLFLMGNHSGAGHTHEDKGSFVLEFAGETFAMDPGSCSYASPLAQIYKHCERHNMLVPTGIAERPCPACPLPYDVKPQGRGDATTLSAEIDATPGWEGTYRRWVRKWDSPTPDRITIADEWELERGTGVEWYLQTMRQVTVEDNQVTLHGNRGQIALTVPDNATLRIDQLQLYGGEMATRIALVVAGVQGRLEIHLNLSTRSAQALRLV